MFLRCDLIYHFFGKRHSPLSLSPCIMDCLCFIYISVCGCVHVWERERERERTRERKRKISTDSYLIYRQVSTTSCPTSTQSTSSSFLFTVSVVTPLNASRSMVQAGNATVSVCSTGSSPTCIEPLRHRRSSALAVSHTFCEDVANCVIKSLPWCVLWGVSQICIFLGVSFKGCCRLSSRHDCVQAGELSADPLISETGRVS